LSFDPKSGYDIKKEFDQDRLFFWNESFGQLYPILKEIADEGLVTYEVIARESQPDLKIYTITDEGRQELASWLRQPAEPHNQRDEMLLKVHFGASNSTAMNATHIRRMQDYYTERLNSLETHHDRFEQADEPQPYRHLTLDYGLLVTKAALRWCDEALEKLKET